MNRRDALKVYAGLALLPALVIESLPILHGDGIHDDSAALDAAVAKRPYVVKRELLHRDPWYGPGVRIIYVRQIKANDYWMARKFLWYGARGLPDYAILG